MGANATDGRLLEIMQVIKNQALRQGRHDADDIVQELFLRRLSNMDYWDEKYSNSYFVVMTKNFITDQYREVARKRSNHILDVYSEHIPDYSHETIDLKDLGKLLHSEHIDFLEKLCSLETPEIDGKITRNSIEEELRKRYWPERSHAYVHSKWHKAYNALHKALK